MPEQLLNLLKLCLLALLYLFFLRVARAVWVEVGGPRVRRGRDRAHNRDAGPASGLEAPTLSVAETTSAGPTGPAATTVSAFPEPQMPPTPLTAPSPGSGARARPMAGSEGPELVTIAPHEFAGRRYRLTGELTIGRAGGCQVLLEDTYVSQLHARVFLAPEGAYVEDLGSTNGTYLLRDRDRHQERHKVAGPRLLERGDQVQVGSTVMELVA